MPHLQDDEDEFDYRRPKGSGNTALLNGVAWFVLIGVVAYFILRAGAQ